MITSRSSLIDVAFEVCTALHRASVAAVLCGGSAAAYYTSFYRSRDADFVIAFAARGTDISSIVRRLGFCREGSCYVHPDSEFTVDFVAGPIGIGDDLITSWNTEQRGEDILHILTRTDSVRDRLAAFYHWNDRSSLRSALLVARSGNVDIDFIRSWSERENSLDKFREFESTLSRNSEG